MPLNQRDIALLNNILAQLGAGLSTSDSASVAKIEAVRALLAGALTTRAPAATSATGTIGALNNEVVLAVPQGGTSVSFYSTGTWSGTLTAYMSFDNGANWVAVACSRADSSISPSITIAAALIPYITTVPPGATHVKARCTAYTSGSLTTTVSIGVNNMLPPIQQLILAGGANRIGSVFASGIWYNHSVTPLAGGATFTGASIDATVTAASTIFGSGSTIAKEVNIGAFADVTGTLQIEVSTDNVTWRLYDSVATTAVGAGFVAKMSYKPITRYWRVKFVNGAGAQGAFLLNSIAMAA